MALSGKERDRLKVLHGALKGQIRQSQAAEQMEVSERWIRELIGRMREQGDRAAVHGLRGRSSNRRIPAAVEQRAVELVRVKYADFGPTLAAEYLAEKHRIRVSRETMRKWMMAAGIWRKRRPRVERVHLWRPRRSCFGELVQWDTSEHDWLEGRGEELYLIAMIDDATSRAWGRFVGHDSTEENMRVLWGWLKRYGRPLAFYTDKASLFQTNRPQQRDEELEGQLPQTQIGRALEELGIGWIAAHSPQAKGRIERCFETLQDRLVKGLRIAGATTMEQANEYLKQQFWPLWERRFTVLPANPTDAHRPLGRGYDLAAILSHAERRVVRNDYTIRFEGQSYQIGRADVRPGLRGSRLRVEKRLDGTVAARFRHRYLAIQLCQTSSRPPRAAAEPQPSGPAKKRPTRDWMQGFNLNDSPPLWKILRQEQGLAGRRGE